MGLFKIDVILSAPFPLGELQAEVEYEGGSFRCKLVDGCYSGSLPGRAIRVRLLDRAATTGGGSGASPGRTLEGEPPIAVEQVFTNGVTVPVSGVVRGQLVWGTPCHQAIDTGEGRRFGSYEHQLCADAVGFDAAGNRLRIGARSMPVDRDTLLAAGTHRLRFGDLIALAGDFYASLDEAAAAHFGWAWPELRGFAGWVGSCDYRTSLAQAEPGEPENILEIVARDKDAKHGVAGELCALIADSIKGVYPTRRYLALASQNYCHFGDQPSDGTLDDAANNALRLYRAYHTRALAEAAVAGDDENALLRAFVCDAFGCHFLTDLFASGHIRVPRQALGQRYGLLVGALWRSHRMHAEDNELGLWCAARGTRTARERIVWRAFGDGMLRTDAADTHRAKVREAVRRSAAEVFAASCGESVPSELKAEWLIPVPLAAGECPRASDEVPGNAGADLKTPNHYPLYRLLPNGRVETRSGGPHESLYHSDAEVEPEYAL